MNEGSNRAYSNPPVRDVPIYQEALRHQHNLHQQEYEQFHRDRALQFREIENSQTDKYRETEDRTSLIKRINTLLVEVDRLSQEKNELASALHEERMISGEMQRKVKHSGKAKNIVDRNLQSDLKFEKEENSRLRHLLHQIEIERAELRSKLKDYELSVSSSAYEKKEMASKIQQKVDQVLILETDNRALNEKVMFLQEKLVEIDGETSNLLRDRGNLCENVSRLEIDRSELIMKLHEEVARNENFQATKNSEIENMKWVQKRHCRLLASRSIGLELEKLAYRTYNYALSKVKLSVSFDAAVYKGTQKIIANAIKYYVRRKKSFFDQWRAQLNWRSTQGVRLRLVDAYSEKNTKQRLFAEWRCLFLNRLRIKRQKALCVSVLSRLLRGKLENSLRTRFVMFKAYCFQDKSKDFTGSKLTIRAFIGKLRSALIKWKRFSEKMKEVQCREDLATDFASAFVRARFFYALKEHTKLRIKEREIAVVKGETADKLYQITVLNELQRYTQQKAAKNNIVKRMVKRWVLKDLYRALSTWKNEVTSFKRMEKIGMYLKGNDLTKAHIVKEKLFIAWKHFVTLNKLQKTTEELKSEKPLREHYEEHYKITLAEKRHLHQIKAGRIFAKCFFGEIYSYFTHWKDHTVYYKESKPRIRRMIMKQYILRVGTSFRKWKKSVMDMGMQDLFDKNSKYAESNSALLDHVSNLEEALSYQIGRHQDLSRATMKRVILRIMNFQLSSGLRSWAQNAFKTSNKLAAAGKLETTLKNFIYRQSLVKIMARSIHNKRRDFTKRKLTNFVMMQLRGSTEFLFDAWKNFLQINKRFKQMLIKFAHRKGLLMKQFYLNRLKKKIVGQRESELISFSQKISSEKDSLQRNLESMTDSYNQESARATKFLKNLKKRSRLRVVNALIRCSQGTRRLYWDRWLASISLKDSKIMKMGKLRHLWDKNCERRAWRKWIMFIKKKFEVMFETEIVTLKKNTKALQREAKLSQEGLQQEIMKRDLAIESCEKRIEYEEMVKEFLLIRSTKQFEQEYSESRSAFAFKAMKARYSEIKKTTLRFASLFQHLRKKYALLSIKHLARQQSQIDRVHNFLMSVCKKFSLRFLRHKFDTWHINSNQIHAARLQFRIRTDTMKINELNALHRNIQKNNIAKVMGMLMNKSQASIFEAWVGAVRQLKSIRLAKEKFLKFSRNARTSLVVDKWSRFLGVSKDERVKIHKAIRNYMSKLMLRVFKSWKSLHEVGKYFGIVFGGLNKRYYRDSLFTGLAAIKTYTAQKTSESQWRGKSQNSSISRLIYGQYRKLLLKGFKPWVSFMSFKETAQSRVRRSILRALHRKFRTAFELWQECFKLKRTFELVNREGPVAIENSMLKDRNNLLMKLISDEGIDSRYVERYINERENLKTALKRKGINRLRYKAGLVNPNDTTLMPRIFTTWKLWVLKRQRIMRFAHRMLAYRKRPELMHAFLTWKRGFPLVVNTVSKLPRKDLYGLVARMDRDIKTLEGRLESTNSDLVYMNAYSEVLQSHTRRGQNLALVVCKSNIQRTFSRVFLRWTIHTNLCKVHDLLAQLTSVEENFYITKTTLKALEEDNQNMMDENLELRQASLDGIAIAEAFETLTKERERLSVDLAERTATIKRLLEHNNELALRLKQFSADDKFITPEREMYRTKKY